MIGVEGVVNAVHGLLRDRMPFKLDELRTRYDILDGSLENIDRWLLHEPEDVAVDKPPLVVIVEQESDNLQGPTRILGDGTGGSVYRYRYRLTIFGWARGATFDSTGVARRRYGLAIREILLQTPGVGVDDPGTIVIVPESMIETYSSVERDGASREIIAATAITVEYETQEELGPRIPPTGVLAARPAATVGLLP